jgi:hypothetical protein
LPFLASTVETIMNIPNKISIPFFIIYGFKVLSTLYAFRLPRLHIVIPKSVPKNIILVKHK